MKLKDNFKVSENFWVNEFLTNVDKANPTYEQISNITKLCTHAEIFRSFVKKNMFVTSGIRSVAYNTQIKGSKGSFHTTGQAMDVELGSWINGRWVEDYGDWTVESLLSVAEKSGFRNIGFYVDKNGKFQWLHLDNGKQWEDGQFEWKKYSDTLSYRIWNI